MGSLTDLYSVVRRKCPGVIDVMMLGALQEAYKEFSIVSESLTANVTLFSVKSLVPEKLPIPTDHALLKIESMSGSTLSREYPLCLGRDFSIDFPDAVIANSDFDSITGVIALVPHSDMPPESADDRIITLYSDEIASGASAILRNMPSELWYNPQISMQQRADFIEGARMAYRNHKDGYASFKNKTRKRAFY